MAKLVYSPEAQEDLYAIGDYIAAKLHNPSAALRVTSGVYQAVDRLRDFPEMGAPLVCAQEQTRYRYLVCESYMVFYHYQEDTAHVDRILYGRRDYAAVLFGGELTAEEDDETK